MTESAERILEKAYKKALKSLAKPIVTDVEVLENITVVARCLSNRAGVRVLLACTLAKLHKPSVDIRNPYTEITQNSFSGRDYDQKYVWAFADKYELPVNTTTAFLTPGFRTLNKPLTQSSGLQGRPQSMYDALVQLLDKAYQGKVTEINLLAETIRQLLLLKQEQKTRMQQLLDELKTTGNGIPLSSEDIVALIQQHLNSPKSSRLPVIVVAAAYKAAEQKIGERTKSLQAHNAADIQTGALGDVEITLVNDESIITSYEMKAKEVAKEDIDLALRKVISSGTRVDNYIFITTARIDREVNEYAVSLYRETGGIEFAVLDCIGFLRHFLHFFHRLRMDFLEAYQALMLAESDSAINQPLKEAFLNLRRAAELSNSD